MKIRKITSTLIIALAAATLMSANALAATKNSRSTASSEAGSICSTCSGHGAVSCTWCSGTGQMSVAGMSYTCSSCSGTGRMQCLGCNGTGQKRKFKKETPVAAPAGATANPGTFFNPPAVSYGYQIGTGSLCPICNGSGRRVCQSCSGNGFTTSMKHSANYGAGSTPYWINHSCAACHSSGQVPCTHCGGDGMR